MTGGPPSELIAARCTVEETRQRIGATTLGYLSLEGVVRAVGLPKSKFCRACFDGQYPIRVPHAVRISKLMLETPKAREDADGPAAGNGASCAALPDAEGALEPS